MNIEHHSGTKKYPKKTVPPWKGGRRGVELSISNFWQHIASELASKVFSYT